MKHRRTTPAPPPRTPHNTRRRSRNAMTQPSRTTQHTLWDYVHTILPTNHPAPAPPPPNTEATMNNAAPDEIATPPSTPVPRTIPDSQNDPQQPLPATPPNTIQQQLQSDKSNRPWGDTALFEKSTHSFRVVSKNTSTLNPHKLDMLAITEELMSKGVSVFAAQETNINWNKDTTPMILAQARRTTPHIALTTSTSCEQTENWYKPGGTMVLAINHCTSRLIDRGTDNSLGRWSYLEFVGKLNKRVIIVSAYQVCNQKFDATSDTASAQQIRILQANGVPSPDPRKIFLADLIEQINLWRSMQKEVLLCMDTNDNVDDPKAKISRLFSETDLSDLHYHRYPSQKKPATYQRGSRPIDLMAGSPLIVEALTAAWMCPFNYPSTIKGDHRLLGVDLDHDILFGTSTEDIAIPSKRGVKSKQAQTVQKFCKRVISKCNQKRIAERIDHLLTLPEFTEDSHRELEQVDSQLTKILTTSDKECCPANNAPWSPALNQAYLRHRFWSITFSAKKNQRDMDDVLKALREKIQPSTEDQLEQTRSLNANLRHAQQNLRKEKREADLLRQKHLDALLNEALASKKKRNQSP